MSVIGSQPALRNQDLLVACRDQYENSNDIRPGLGGLAQINGRDESVVEGGTGKIKK